MDPLEDQSEQHGEEMHAARLELVRSLINEQYTAVYRFAYRLTGNSVDAEDLTQHSFLKACEKIDQLQDPERARSWLFTIVRNHFLKSKAKRDLETTTLEPEAVVSHDPTDEFEFEIDSQQLQQVLDAMPETYRLPVLLYYFEELSYKEIAAALEVPIGTVMSRLARGKSYLRAEFSTAASKTKP